MQHWEDLIDHAFTGARFDDGPLDVEAMAELPAYRALVVRLAEELWRKRNPDRQRLPRNFSDRFRLRCSRIDKGSSVAVLERSREPGQLELSDENDAFDDAVLLLVDAVNAANDGTRLPNDFPKGALPLFRNWGRGLRDGEAIALRPRARQTAEAVYSAQTRSHLLGLVEVAYEDTAETTGHVLATSIRQGRFELYPDPTAAYGIDVPLSSEHERTVLDALAAYSDVTITVKGKAAFSTDGRVVRYLEVASVEAPKPFEPDNSDLWSRIAQLSASVPDDVWRTVPPDASQRIDEYLRDDA